MECHGIQRPSLGEIIGLGLLFGLRPMKEHAIAYRDACGPSSLKVRGTLSVTPRPETVYGMCNRRVAYVHQRLP